MFMGLFFANTTFFTLFLIEAFLKLTNNNLLLLSFDYYSQLKILNLQQFKNYSNKKIINWAAVRFEILTLNVTCPNAL